MAEVVKKLGLPQPDGFLYFVEGDCTVWKHQGGQKTIISKSKVKREEGYLYFIDINGDLADPESVLNEGNQAILDSWNTIRSYCEGSNTGVNTDRCK